MYAGKKRKSDMHAVATRLVQRWGQKLGVKITLVFEDYDILRGGEDEDLLNPELQQALLDKILQGNYDLLILAPPCTSWSRALFNGRPGPRPVRDRVNPMGRRTLQGVQRHKAETGNAHIIFALKAMAAAKESTQEDNWRITRAILEHPEDYGENVAGCPASIFQLKKTRALIQLGFSTGAFYQCNVAPVDYRKPTRLVHDVPGLQLDLYPGWPRFQSGRVYGRWTRFAYSGPLPKACGHAHLQCTVGRDAQGHFPTGELAAYHEDMCEWLMEKALEDFGQRWSQQHSVGGASAMPPRPVEEAGLRLLTVDELKERLQEELQTSHGDVPLAMPDNVGYTQEVLDTAIQELKDVEPMDVPSDEVVRQAASDRRKLVELKVAAALRRPATQEAPPEEGPLTPQEWGWRGHGHPMTVGSGERERQLVDGGGLCSPGIWPPQRRRYPTGVAAGLGDLIKTMLSEWETGSGAGTLQAALSELVKGRCRASPFPSERIAKIRAQVDALLEGAGCAVTPPRHKHPLKQRMAFMRLAMLLKEAGDPDWRFFANELAGRGVRIGVGVELPRTRAVFPPKTKWRLPIREGDPEPTWKENYVSSATRIGSRSTSTSRPKGAWSSGPLRRRPGGATAAASLWRPLACRTRAWTRRGSQTTGSLTTAPLAFR